MEPLFTNKCSYTKEVILEAYLSYNKRERRILTPIILICDFLGVAMSFIHFEFPLMMLLFILNILFFFFVFAIPRIIAHRIYKVHLEVLKEPIVGTTDYYDDKFVSIAYPTKAELNIQYSQLKRIISSNNLYLLVIRFQLFFIVDKNGFDKINMVEFEKFIEEKAPKAKIHF